MDRGFNRVRFLMVTFRKKILITAGCAVCVMGCMLFVFMWISRERIVHRYLDRKFQEIERQCGVSIPYEAVELKSFHTIRVRNLAVIPHDSGRLLSIGTLSVRLNTWKLFSSQVEIRSLEVKDPILHANRENRKSPLRFIYDNDRENNFAEKTEQIFRFLSRMYSGRVTLHNLRILFQSEGEASVVGCDTLMFDMPAVHREDVLVLEGNAGVKGLQVEDRRVAADNVLLKRGYISYRIRVGRNFFELDDTQVYFNTLKLNPRLRVEKNRHWHLTASLDKADFPANTLLESIPEGLFRHIEGLRAEGTLSYHFFLDADLAKVEKLRFESTLDAQDFRITEYGKTDLRLMNSPFPHTIQEKGKPARTFVVGSENPRFRPYHSISRYLPYAIMHGEDSEFFGHKGFLQDAFRRSLVQNIEERRFARGGSTLSMQVVKNVFLGRDKTIARKLEEILIVWLIETGKLTSKQRMFEVYMNIIEWGPGIYGVTEAARFYFNKDPAALTLTECVFLAYIIPAPQRVREHFNGLEIKPAFYPFYYNAVKRMYQRNWISYGDRAASNPRLRITGPAAGYLLR